MSFPNNSPKYPPSDERAHHGNCCASKALGWSVGVAKKADLVAVQPYLHKSYLIQAFEAILKDIKRKKLYGKAVISYSLLGRR